MKIPYNINFESSAKFLLESLFAYEFEKEEHPDFHDYKKNVGLEVTRAISKNEGEMIGFIDKIKDKKLSSVGKKEIEKFEKLGGSISENNGIKTISFGNNFVSVDRLKDVIYNKSIKLSSEHFNCYGSNHLFVFSDRAPIKKHHIVDIIKKLHNTNLDITFDLIYIFDFFTLWYFSPKLLDSIVKKKIPENILCEMYKILNEM